MAKYDLVFEGGGAKGSVFVGALSAFYAAGHTARRLVGTSAGAITSTLLAAGYTPGEMLDAVNERDANGRPRFASFMDDPTFGSFSDAQIAASATMEALEAVDIPLVPDGFESMFDRELVRRMLKSPLFCHLFSFNECGGFFAGDAFVSWFEEKLAVKGVAADATIASFFETTGVDLSLVASDTTGPEMLVLNHRTAPDCPIVRAVRMSMSIPFVWKEIVWKSAWGSYRGRDISNHTIVDGGVLSNFPVRLVAERGADVVAIMGDTDPDGAGTIGLLIDENVEVPSSGAAKKTYVFKHKLRTVERVVRLADTMTGASDNSAIRDHPESVCRLPAKGYGTTEFDMSTERLAALVEAGRTSMVAYLSAGSGGGD